MRFILSSRTMASVSALMASNVTAVALNAVGGCLVARFVGPEEIGTFRVYTIPLSYLIFLHLGTWDGLWRQIPYYVGTEQPEEVELLASAAGAFNLFVSVAVSCGFLCCLLYNMAQGSVNGSFGWLSQLLFCWMTFYGGYLTSTYRTMRNFVTLARIQVIHAAATFAAVFTLPFLGFYGLCGRLALPSLLAVWLYHRNRPLKVPYVLRRKQLAELLKVGFPFSFWGNLYTSLWSATEAALVLSLSGVYSLGLFSMSCVLGAAATSLPMAVWQVLTPQVVTQFAKGGSVREPCARMLVIASALTASMVLVAVLGSLVLDWIVPLLIPKYVSGLTVMKLFLWFAVVQAAFLPINAIFAVGDPWRYGRSVIAGIVVFPLTTFLLTPTLGGLLAVTIGSLLGRIARTVAAYGDLYLLWRSESQGIAEAKGSSS